MTNTMTRKDGHATRFTLILPAIIPMAILTLTSFARISMIETDSSLYHVCANGHQLTPGLAIRDKSGSLRSMFTSWRNLNAHYVCSCGAKVVKVERSEEENP